MTKQQLVFAAAAFNYSVERMAWALEPHVSGECGWLAGCHDPVDPDSPDGHCTRHASYMQAHAPMGVA